MLNAKYWKIGFHTSVGGNRNDIDKYWQAAEDTACPAVLVSADDYGPCFELANRADASGVPHVIAFRLTTYGQGNDYSFDVPPYGADINGSASQYWQKTLEKLPPEFDKERVWVIVCNEVDKQHADWLGRFGVAVAKLAKQSGHKILFPAWSSGEPERDAWETAGMLGYLQYCSDNPDVAGVSIHEYSFTVNDLMYDYPYRLGRFQMLLTVCGYHKLKPKVLITEFGWEERQVPTAGSAIPELRSANQIYNIYPEIIGAAIWYLGSGFGGIADQTQKLILPVADEVRAYGFELFPDQMVNGGFEDDYAEDHTTLKCSYETFPHIIQVGNIMTPPGWLSWFYHSSEFAQPEIRDSRALDPDRMHEGEKGQMLFTFFKKHAGGLLQQITTTPGQTISLSAWAHAWSNHQDGPHPDDPKWSEGAGFDAFWGYTDQITDDDLSNFQFKIGVDPYGGLNPYDPSVVWGRGTTIYNVFHELDTLFVQAQSDTVTIYLKSDTRWAFKHNDAYWDSVTITGDVPMPETDSEYFWRRSVEIQATCGIRLNAEAALQKAIELDGMLPIESEFYETGPESGLSFALQGAETLDNSIPRRLYKWDPRTGEVSWEYSPF